MIAINFDLLSRLGSDMQAHLRESAENGATVYVRGALQPGRRFPLRPFSDRQFEFLNRPADGYQFSTRPILPAAIAGERITTQLNMPLCIDPGSATPSIFSIEVGAGLAIFDLHPDHQYDERDFLADLSAPTRRTAGIGALSAVDWVAGRNPAITVPVNLVIDDRPINYDYFTRARCRSSCVIWTISAPGVHTDFAWTPAHTRPHREYLNVLGRHNTGFVWHGFLRHS